MVWNRVRMVFVALETSAKRTFRVADPFSYFDLLGTFPDLHQVLSGTTPKPSILKSPFIRDTTWREHRQQSKWDSWPERSPFGPQFAMQEPTRYNL